MKNWSTAQWAQLHAYFRDHPIPDVVENMVSGCGFVEPSDFESFSKILRPWPGILSFWLNLSSYDITSKQMFLSQLQCYVPKDRVALDIIHVMVHSTMSTIELNTEQASHWILLLETLHSPCAVSHTYVGEWSI